jgi:putative membrane protein
MKMGPGHFGMGWGGTWLYPIIVIAVVLIVIYILFGRRNIGAKGNNQNRCHTTSGYPESALDILKKRYAKGEITKTEYEQMKRNIL